MGLGAQPGDVLAVLLPNMPEYVIVMMGASEAGLTVTTLNPAYTPRNEGDRQQPQLIVQCQGRSAAN